MARESLPTLAALAIDTAVRLGVTTWVIAPGSRSAPLTAALAARDGITRYVVYDERSAGYVALGLAQQLERPVGLVCTSGTAAANFLPAVVEAFYQGVPLLVLTADRPPEWIDQEDNQAIRQNGLYGAHAKASFTFPLDDGRADTHWYAARVVGDALQVAAALPRGPVQLNVPLREPLYTPAPQPIPRPARLVEVAPARPALGEAEWERLVQTWQQAPRKLLLGGLHPAHDGLTQALTALSADPSVALLGDVTSNAHAVPGFLRHAESLLQSGDTAALDSLAPDLVLTFGGQITARAFKSFLRARPPAHFWRVSPVRPAPDTFQALTLAIPMAAPDFLSELARRAAPRHASDYGARWAAADRFAAECWPQAAAALPFGDFAAVDAVLHALPAGSALQLGNSMPIRYANIAGFAPDHLPASVNANRGTSGIDGTVSTAVGAALARPDRLTTLIVGDLAFFYDRNGLWHHHLPANLRIVLLNNHGGGIFDLIDGPRSLPPSVQRDYFLTPHTLSARRTAEDFDLRYAHAASRSELDRALAGFFTGDGPALLEVESEAAANAAAFAEAKRWAAALRLA